MCVLMCADGAQPQGDQGHGKPYTHNEDSSGRGCLGGGKIGV
jgi:hypothetical protein